MYRNTAYGNQNLQSYQSSSLSHGMIASTAGSTWNGSAWVNNNYAPPSLHPPPPPPSTELPKIPPHLQGTVDTNNASASRLVTFYSEVYSYWDSQVTACKTSGDTMSTPYQWAVYYSDLSSRAAHHYNGIVEKEKSNPVNSSIGHRYSQVAPAAAPAAAKGPPQSFNDYAHRCLSQCATQTQKNSMKEMIEMTIRKSLQNGDMHTKNWSAEPLISLFKDTTTSTSSSAHTAARSTSSARTNETNGKTFASVVSNSLSNNKGQPQPSTSRRNKRMHNVFEQNLPENDSYYGFSPSKSEKGKTEKNSNYFGSSSAVDGDFIALSSLSSDRYVKTNNKLAKITKKTKKSNKKQKTKDGFDATAHKLASRADRFSGQGGIDAASSNGVHSVYKKDIDRYMGKTVIGGNSKKLGEEDYEKMTVKGTSQVLEKGFLRLTAPPKSDRVRPLPILERHLTNIKKLRKNIRTGKIKPTQTNWKEYNWFCSQLKAIRQDMTVQRIFNGFAVKVYETHARIALEEGDVNEFNQSQTQLKSLYEQLSHKTEKDAPAKDNALQNQNEFIAYRVIYHVFLTCNKKYEGGSTDLFKIMLSLTAEQTSDPFIAHALKVRIAVADNDYHAYFRLQDICPNHGAYLMDLMLPHIRSIGLKCIMKAYRPSLNVNFILTELGFSFQNKLCTEEGVAWLKGCRCVFSDDKALILTKDTVLDESFVSGNKTSSLI